MRDRKARPARAATTSATSTASRPRPTSAGSGTATRRWCCARTGGRWWTARGASGCSTSVRREALAARGDHGPLDPRLCRSGFDAVEFDNLDSFTRSRRLLTRAQAVVYARLLVNVAHAAGLSAGQKNLADFNGRKVGYDFAVAEECGRYRECASYVANYGRRVLVDRVPARRLPLDLRPLRRRGWPSSCATGR